MVWQFLDYGNPWAFYSRLDISPHIHYLSYVTATVPRSVEVSMYLRRCFGYQYHQNLVLCLLSGHLVVVYQDKRKCSD